MTQIWRKQERPGIWIDFHSLAWAAGYGFQRQLNAIENNRRDPDEYYSNKWQNHIEGALAEYAVAMYFDVTWQQTVGQCGRLDVGPFEVRQTGYRTGELVIQTDEHHPDAPFILVVGDYGKYKIAGFVPRARDFMNKDFETTKVKGRRPAFWIPQAKLTPIAAAWPMLEKWKAENP